MPATLDPVPTDLFALALREGASRLGYTRREIAHRARVSTRSVSRWSMGDLLPHENQRARVLEAFAPAGREIVDRMRRAFGLPPLPPDPPPAPPPEPPPSPSPDAIARANAEASRAREREIALAIYEAAEKVECPPRLIRAALAEVLARAESVGATLDEARRAITREATGDA